MPEIELEPAIPEFGPGPRIDEIDPLARFRIRLEVDWLVSNPAFVVPYDGQIVGQGGGLEAPAVMGRGTTIR